jgi:hypothetical protein
MRFHFLKIELMAGLVLAGIAACRAEEADRATGGGLGSEVRQAGADAN